MASERMELAGGKLGALVDPIGGRRLESAEIDVLIAARGARFARSGMTRDQRVFFLSANTPEFFVDLLAVWRLGACVIPIDPRLTSFEVDKLARAARPAFALPGGQSDQAVIKALAALNIPMIGDETDSSGDAPPDVGRAEDPALILFTSGTTGDPKGVVHSHRALRARWAALRDTLGTAAYARTLCLLPTHFGHGLICNALFPWLSGCDLFVLPPFQAELLSRLGPLIDLHGITALSSVPALWTLALRLSPPPRGGTLRRVHCGSAPLGKALRQQVQAWSGGAEVLNSYGITETASWVAGTVPGTSVVDDGFIGRAWGAEIRILDPAATDPAETPCPPGLPGMVWLRTPALMDGYFERDALTAAVVRDGWFRTGDIGTLDADGNLHLRGRERDEINKGGMKIYPGDIDSLAVQCPGVVDACAFAVADRLYGQDVGLAVVLAGETAGALAALKDFLGARLARHQMPVRWHVVAEIPRSDRGKIKRDQVATACAASPAL